MRQHKVCIELLIEYYILVHYWINILLSLHHMQTITKLGSLTTDYQILYNCLGISLIELMMLHQ